MLFFTCSVVSNSAPSWTAALQVSLFFTISQFAQTHIHWVSDAIQLPHHLPPLFPHAFNHPSIRFLSNYSALGIGKTKALIIWTLVGKVRSLLFNTLSRFVIAFLPRSKHGLNSWLHCSDFGAQEKKVCHSFHFSPSIFLEVMGPEASFWMLNFKLAFSLSFINLYEEAL